MTVKEAAAILQLPGWMVPPSTEELQRFFDGNMKHLREQASESKLKESESRAKAERKLLSSFLFISFHFFSFLFKFL